MKRTILLIIAGTLLFCLGFQVSEIMGKHTTDPQSDIESEPATAADIDMEAEISAEFEGAPLNDSVKILNYKGEPVGLAAISGDSILVARFSTSACRPCVNALMASLQRFARSHPDRRIAVLLKNAQLRDLYVMAPDFGPQFSLYSCDALPIDFEDAGTPVLFKVNSDGKVTGHFTCRYGDYERTDNYLQGL